MVFLRPLYELVWRLALPMLKQSPRLCDGWRERRLQEGPDGPCDLWIQAASGGEALLTNLLVEQLPALLPHGRRWRLLVTSGTRQGVDSLTQGCRQVDERLEVMPAFFPFDAPSVMARAFTRFRPKLAVTIETELWPGFLMAARHSGVPVLLVNGRLSAKSFGSYRYLARFFQEFGPARVLAVSPADADRFARLLGRERVGLMNNMKFDRVRPGHLPAAINPMAALLPKDRPLVVLGSIRREEEGRILKTITELLTARPDLFIGLFPKHIERAARWLPLLAAQGIAAVKRSAITAGPVKASVMVWDRFGELAGAYGLAKAAFVGGSLADLGGQNFLEPLTFGLKPIIGPHWSNFAWVGREILATGLVREVADHHELAGTLLEASCTETDRNVTIRQVQHYLAPRQGGTLQACRQIISTMDNEQENL